MNVLNSKIICKQKQHIKDSLLDLAQGHSMKADNIHSICLRWFGNTVDLFVLLG